ncbi:MAG TPA: F0F1 ATP synthase subunit A [Anaerolineales bacterium]|nr:F0F1 ATP synthase subunit A [Anaerolineales bacterium]
MEKPRKWRWGVNRWLILLFVILSIFAAQAYPPILPHVQLPAEHLTEHPLFSLPVIGDFYLTNTLLATLIADILLLLMAITVYRATLSGNLVPKGLAGAVEALLEVIYNLTESTAGKWARTIFPFFATITLLVLVVNWMELIPGVDSIGFLHPSEHGYPVYDILPGVSTIVKAGGEAEGEAHGGFLLVPFVRVASTDLNFTVALALISVFMVQAIGLRALGAGYLTKFINVKTIFTRPIFGVIDFGVGILEFVSEFSRILSFAFRLFGNIFAGSVLLFVIGSLVPVFAQSGVLMLEFFVGLIQAVVFGMLTMVFMAQATQGHGEHEEHEEEMPIPEATI